MGTVTVETKISNKGEMIKRIERKHTKGSMAYILADVYWILTDEKMSDEDKLKELHKLNHKICWG